MFLLEALLAQHPLEAGEPIYAGDASVWARCDAETSPQRAFYHHPSPHSAGQPMVAGWAYHWIAQINFAHDSWTAPRKIRRLKPQDNVNQVAVEHIKELLQEYPRDAPLPIFVFDAGRRPGTIGPSLGFLARGCSHALTGRTLLFCRAHFPSRNRATTTTWA